MNEELSPAKLGSDDDVWIPSACGMCYNQCGIRGHRVADTLVKIESNPDNPIGRGRLCARGLAGIQLLYDPHRVNHPLRRTACRKFKLRFLHHR